MVIQFRTVGPVNTQKVGTSPPDEPASVWEQHSGKDPVLGLSAGLKHFGKRRLGRSGIDHDFPVPDNVWDIDCSRSLQAKR